MGSQVPLTGLSLLVAMLSRRRLHGGVLALLLVILALSHGTAGVALPFWNDPILIGQAPYESHYSTLFLNTTNGAYTKGKELFDILSSDNELFSFSIVPSRGGQARAFDPLSGRLYFVAANKGAIAYRLAWYEISTDTITIAKTDLFSVPLQMASGLSGLWGIGPSKTGDGGVITSINTETGESLPFIDLPSNITLDLTYSIPFVVDAVGDVAYVQAFTTKALAQEVLLAFDLRGKALLFIQNWPFENTLMFAMDNRVGSSNPHLIYGLNNNLTTNTFNFFQYDGLARAGKYTNHIAKNAQNWRGTHAPECAVCRTMKGDLRFYLIFANQDFTTNYFVTINGDSGEVLFNTPLPFSMFVGPLASGLCGWAH